MAIKDRKDNLGVEFKRFHKIEGSAELSPKFPDYYNSASDTYNIAGGADPRYVLFTMKIPEAPPFGSALLKNLELLYYTDSFTPGSSLSPISISAYKLKDTDYLNYDASKVTTNKGIASGTAPTIADSNTKSPLFFAATSCNHPLQFYSENFDGVDNTLSGNGEYVTLGRSLTARIGPYMETHDVAMYGQKSRSLEIDLPVNWGTDPEMYGYKIKWIQSSFGTKMGTEQEDTGQRYIVRLKNYNDTFWVTKDIHGGEDPLYVRKNHVIGYSNLAGRDVTTADLLYRTERISDDGGALYGDEVMPSNSIFTSVRGDKELLELDIGGTADASSTENTPYVIGTSAVRYKKEGAKSGQLCNFVSFRNDTTNPTAKFPAVSDAVSNPMNEDNSEAKIYTDCVAAINNIPIPHPVGSPVPGLLKSVSGGYTNSAHSGTGPTDNQQGFGGYAHPTIEMHFTIEELAPAYEFDVSGTHWISGTARAFTILFSNLPCATANYRLRDYYDQITDTNNLTDDADDTVPALDYMVGGMVFWKNENNKIQMTTVGRLDYSSTNKPTDFNHDYVFLKGTDVGHSTPSNDNQAFVIPENTPLKMTITWADPLIMNRAYVNIYTEVDDVLGMSEVCIASMEVQMAGPSASMGASSDAKCGVNDGGLPIGTSTATNQKGNFAASGTDYDKSSPHMSFWLSSTQEKKSGSGNGEQDINVDAGLDIRSSVSIDSIAFLNYNNRIDNATVFRDASKVPTGKHAYYSAASIPENPLTYQNWSMCGNDIADSNADWPALALPKYGAIKAYNSAGAVEHVDVKGSLSNGRDTVQNFCSKGPGGTTFAWGFKSKSDLDGATRYSLMNGFACMNLHQNADIDSAMFTGGYTTPLATSSADVVPLGGQCLPVNIDPTKSPNALRVGNNDSTDDILIGSVVPNDVNNMTSGGWMRWNFSDSRAGPEGTTRSAWTSRECIFSSARVLRAIRGSGASVLMQVDQLDIFRCEADQEYIAYQVGAEGANDYYATGIEVIGTAENNYVVLSWDGMADDDSTDLLDNSTNKLNNLMIGPKAFWVWMTFGNFKDSASGLAWDGPSAGASVSGWNNPNNLEALPNKTYASMLFTTGQGTAGATFNEWCYSHDDGDLGAVNQQIKGAHQASWNLNVGAGTDSLFDLEKDYGFGKYKVNDENDKGYEGGEVGMSSPNTSNYSTLVMPKITEVSDLETGSFMSLFLKLSDTSDHVLTIKSDNASTKSWVDPASYEPFISATYFDMLPLPLEDFKFVPNEEDPWIPRLEWSVSDEDLWYGIAHFDTEPVNHQYHKAILHFPLNESSGAGGVLFRDDPSKLLKVYNYENGEKSHQKLDSYVSGRGTWHSQYMYMDKNNILTDPHGLAGNATIFGSGRYSSASILNGNPDGNVLHRGVIAHPVGTAKSTSNDDDDANTGGTLPFTPTVPSEAFSLSMHVIPDSKPRPKYQLKGAGGTPMTYSLNHDSAGSSQYWAGYSAHRGNHKIKEALDASETTIDTHTITTFCPSYPIGIMGVNKMQEDFGTAWIAAGESKYNASTGDYDADDSIIIRVDDEFMKVVSVNPGTLTEITSEDASSGGAGGTAMKLDSGYYDGSESDSNFDLDSTGRIFRVNVNPSHTSSTIKDILTESTNGGIILVPGRDSQGYYVVETVKVGDASGNTLSAGDGTDDGSSSGGKWKLYANGGTDYQASSPFGRFLDPAPSSGTKGYHWVGHVDLTDTSTTPSTNGEVVFNNVLLEDVTSIQCFDKDEDGDELDDGENGIGDNLNNSDSSSFTHANTATNGRIMRIVKKSDPSEANAVYYNVTGGAVTKASNSYTLTVEWIGGKKGIITSILSDEDDILISNYGRNDTSTRNIKPVMVLGNKPYVLGGTINAVGNQSNPFPDTRPDYLPASGATFYKITNRSIEVIRGYGGTTATTHSANATIQRVSENSPVIGGISALSELDDLDGSTLTGPYAYDSQNQDQMWKGAILDIGNERFATPMSIDIDSSWSSSGWARGIENTDWAVHSADSVYVVPRYYLFHSYTGNSLLVNSLNALAGANLNQGEGSAGKPVVSAFMDSDGKINVHAYIENQSYKTPLMVQSKAAIPTDGITPTHIGVVFDKDLPSQNLKLFLNGKLEDSTGMRQNTGGINNLQDNADGQTGEPLLAGMGTVCIGGLPYVSSSTHLSTNSFDGIIEDVTIWARAVNFINPETGSFDYTKPYHELEEGVSTSSSSTLYGKMFIKDYHNIRGTNPEKVRASPTAVLRKSAFALDTS